MKKIRNTLLFILLFAVKIAWAQELTVSGTVSDRADRLALPGVSILVRGTTTGTQTDANGRYEIKVPGPNSELEFRFVGYQTQVVRVDGRTIIDISLVIATQQLGEVVIKVPYGIAKKGAITGSIATMNAKDLEGRVATNISNLLIGIAPGIQANAGNGQPGTGSVARIRGFGSYSASSAPLYVLDGAVYNGNISDINPNDIESISVLKDATSSALYGARAGNGVIIITTKKGKLGEPRFSINANQGFSMRGTPEYERVGAYDYYPAMWRGLYNSLVYPKTGIALSPAEAAEKASSTIQAALVYNPFNVANNEIVGTDGNINPNAVLKYNDFDWAKPLSRTGKRTDLSMNLGGHSGNSDYFISFSYLNDKGYIQKSDFNRFTGRVNVNSQVKSWLKAGLNFSGALTKGNLASDASTDNATSYINAFSFARGIGPIYPVHAYDDAGQQLIDLVTGKPWYDYGMHPGAVNRPSGASPGRNVVYETLLNENLFNRNALNARIFSDIKFFKDFTFTTNLSADLRNVLGNIFRNKIVGDGATSGGLASRSSFFSRSYTFNQILTYDKSIDKHTFNILAGHENYDFEARSLSADKNTQVATGNTEFDNFVTPGSTDGNSDLYRIESYFGRATYNYDERYFLDGSVRKDGSSRFAPQSRWGTFYSVGASWAISKESFFKNINSVDDLRAKASYGEVGNDDFISSSGDRQYYKYQSLYDLGWNNGNEPGILLSRSATPDLQWESSNSFNTGISFSLFEQRLTGELEYFKRGSSNLLFAVPRPLSEPLTSIDQNIGSMYNKGIELQLGADIVRTTNFKWNVLSNWTWLKNKITKMPETNPSIISGTKKREVGRDLYSFWLRQWGGVDPSDGSALYVPDPERTVPAESTRIVNNVPYTTDFNYAKFDYSGSAIADIYGSVTNTFDYQNFSFSFLINYQIGGKFYDANYQSLMSFRYGSALHADALNSWKNPGDVTHIPRLDNSSTTTFNANSNRWLIDASYISFTNASLAYRLPKSWLSRLDIAGARVFVAGENLALISRRKGMNPTESIEGVNSNTYLPSRVISFGLNVSL